MQKFILGHKLLIGSLAGIFIASGAGYVVLNNLQDDKPNIKKTTTKNKDGHDSNKKKDAVKNDDKKGLGLLDQVEVTFFGANGEGGATYDVSPVFNKIDEILGAAVDFPMEEMEKVRSGVAGFSSFNSDAYKEKLAKVQPWVRNVKVTPSAQAMSLKNGDKFTLTITNGDDPTNPIKPETRTWIVSGLE